MAEISKITIPNGTTYDIKDATARVQPNWTETITTAMSYIQNTPAIKAGTGASSILEGLATASSGQASHAEGYYTTASSQGSHAEGSRTTAAVATAHAEGYQSNAAGNSSHAEGRYSYTQGYASHAEGYGTSTSVRTAAYGAGSHVEGYMTTAGLTTSAANTVLAAHAEGHTTTASGLAAHSEGKQTTASGEASHAEGNLATASGAAAHAEGYGTAVGASSHAENGGYAEGTSSHAENVGSAEGEYSHAEGSGSAEGNYSHAEGNTTTTSATSSHAEGKQTTASADEAHAEGLGTIASGISSHSEGMITTASGIAAHAEGCGGTISDSFTINSVTYTNYDSGAYLPYSHTEGYQTTTSSTAQDTSTVYGAHAEGYQTQATGIAAHAEGHRTLAAYQGAHTEGSMTYAADFGAHAEGCFTKATGEESHAEGYFTTASGTHSHSEGFLTTASGSMAHTEGLGTIASGSCSHAGGAGTIANHDAQHVFGQYNIADTSSAAATTRGNYVEIVGNGTTDNARSNARTLDWEGNERLAGQLYVNMTDKVLTEADVNLLRTNGARIYGIAFDKVNAQCTRLWDAADITINTTNFVHSGSLNANYNNPFDNLYPWNEFKQCNVDLAAYRALTADDDIRDCITAWHGDAEFTTNDPTQFVGRYRPEYWFTGYEDNDIQIFAISTKPVTGWGHSLPCIDSYAHLVDDGSGSTVTCYDAQPLTNIAVSTIHTRAKNSGFTLQNIHTLSAILTAYVVEFANMNAQAVLGQGVTAQYRSNEADRPLLEETDATRVVLPAACASYAIAGATLDFSTTKDGVILANRRMCTGYDAYAEDSNYISVNFDSPLNTTTTMYVSFHGMTNGSSLGNGNGYIGTNGKSQAFYRGAVLFGNRWNYILGAYRQTETSKIFICDDVYKCDNYDAINTTDHIDTGCVLPVGSAYIKTLHTVDNLGLGLVPFCKETGGNSSSPVGDYSYVPALTTDNTILRCSGNANSGLSAGPFSGSWNTSSGSSYWYFGGAAVLLPKQ